MAQKRVHCIMQMQMWLLSQNAVMFVLLPAQML